mgnify:CR=1 FL=1
MDTPIILFAVVRTSLNVIFKIASKFTKSIAFKEVYKALMCKYVREHSYMTSDF